MAKKRLYIDERGIELPESYWRVTQIEVYVPNKSARIQFTGYKDQAARLENKAPIGHKTYVVSGQQFEFWYAKHLIEGINIAQISYEIATGTFDEEVTDPENPEQKVKVSFFDGAEDVL